MYKFDVLHKDSAASKIILVSGGWNYLDMYINDNTYYVDTILSYVGASRISSMLLGCGIQKKK